jgi:hypothetical protein
VRRVEAVFENEDRLRWALSILRSADPDADDHHLELRSSWPLPEDITHEVGAHGGGPPWILIAAILGAVLGGATAFLLGAGTALAYPMPTGGMEIVAGPPLGIVTYEGTALGLILATVAAVFVRARLYRRAPRSAFDRDLADGKLLLTVIDAADGVESTLREAGALEVMVTGDSERSAREQSING